MSETKSRKRLARELYERIWSQRLTARITNETINLEGHQTPTRTIALADGLRIAYFFYDAHPVRDESVLIILPDRTIPLDFIDPHDMERCKISMIASKILHAAGIADAKNGRPVVPNFRNGENDLIPLPHRYRVTDQYLIEHLDTIVARDISRMAATHKYVDGFTSPSGIVVQIRSVEGSLYSGTRDEVWVSHASLKCSVRLSHRSLTAYGDWRRGEAEQILSGSMPTPLAPPPETTGNARLARALDLCHQALQIDPNLTDASGTPLRPLLERHVPDLLEDHRLASRTADARDTDAIDAELEQGISLVCAAIDEGLARIADDRRHALREQLAFLEMRHPSQDRLLGVEPHS